MKALITQSNYIPWKGYFDAIRMVDVVVFYDDALYTKRDWRNRNLIKTKQGLKWLTIPVEYSSRVKDRKKINEVKTVNNEWRLKHWAAIHNSYMRAKHFDNFCNQIRMLYLTCDTSHLCEINYHFLNSIMRLLDINTEVRYSSEFLLRGGKTTKLVNICKELGATDYYTGPAARNYLDEEEFIVNNINVHYFDFSGYPEYPQLYPPFNHGVTILDLLFNTGPDFMNYLKEKI